RDHLGLFRRLHDVEYPVFEEISPYLKNWGAWKMGKRAVFLGLVCIGLVGMMPVMGGCSPAEPVFEGVVETSIYGHYSEVAGKIIELPVELGQEVKAGDVIAILDDTNERYNLEQLEKTLAKKQ